MNSYCFNPYMAVDLYSLRRLTIEKIEIYAFSLDAPLSYAICTFRAIIALMIAMAVPVRPRPARQWSITF